MIHSKFGDLSRLNAVTINDIKPEYFFNLKEDEGIMVHLTVTGRCYAKCKDCVNRVITMLNDDTNNGIVSSFESIPERDAIMIKEIVSNNSARNITVCFYGGEPFIAADRMDSLMRILDESDIRERVRYMVYTNGELLISAIKSYPKLIEHMWFYSVSIDGRRDQHNSVRTGTSLDKIIDNLSYLRNVYKGSILQWSTLREEQSLLDCFEQFIELYNEGLASHFFWHWPETKEPFGDFNAYLEIYSQDLETIMDIYTRKIIKGELLPIVHIDELIIYILTGKERGHSACGVELARNYDIVGGAVRVCADLPCSATQDKLSKDILQGVTERDLAFLVEYKKMLGCYDCGVHPYCGGRCPVQALAGSQERTLQYCQLMRLHIGIVKERINDIKLGLKRNNITIQDIYDHSAFMARYTDVVP